MVQRILYADDDDDDGKMLEEAIGIHDPTIKVTVVENGSTLLRFMKTELQPDMVILDLNMPVMGGMECIERIREMTECFNMPIIVYSTSRNKAEIAACFKMGANYYIAKPYSMEQLNKIGQSIAAGDLQSMY
jgi:CheY-like chemotaxis protein